jgi:hypothetical protein
VLQRHRQLASGGAITRSSSPRLLAGASLVKGSLARWSGGLDVTSGQRGGAGSGEGVRHGGGGVGKADGVVASGGKIASVCPDALTSALLVTMSDKWRKATKV